MKPSDPISELRGTELYAALKAQSEDYAEKIEKFVAGIAPIMATTIQHFPYYTRHDAHHGYQVVRRMKQVLLSNCLKEGTSERLGHVELFLLIAAAYAHDLGMTVFSGEAESLLAELGIPQEPGWHSNARLQAHLRREHSRRGGAYIGAHCVELGVPMNLVHALDLLMQAHNLAVPELERRIVRDFPAAEREIDLLQLALIVCVSDSVEFSDTRVVDGVFGQLERDSSAAARTSFEENMKHVCIGDSLSIGDDGRIVVGGWFNDPDVLALAHFTFDQMEGWLRGYADIERYSKVKRLQVGAEPFVRRLTFSGGRFERLGIRLNTRSVIDLIASNAVWRTNQGVAIRELVQNAVEACRYRSRMTSTVPVYEPHVRVTFDRTTNTVRVDDNGCGMSERTVLNNFLTVGSSRAKEEAYAATGYAPIARFGIGFWSVFTIADHAHIETAAFETLHGTSGDGSVAGFSFDVRLEKLKNYTVFAPRARAPGTSITIKLKSDVHIDDVYSSLRQQVLCSLVPMEVVFDGVTSTYGDELPEISDESIFGTRLPMKQELGIEVFRWQGVREQTEVRLAITYRLVNGKATFLMQEGVSLSQAGEFGLRTPRTAICGFNVPIQVDRCCFELQRVGLFYANHRSPDGVEYALDRSTLDSNDAAEAIKANIWALIHDGYRAFLQATNAYEPATICELNRQSELHGGNVYDQFTGAEFERAAAHYPDLYCLILAKIDGSRLVMRHVDLTGLRALGAARVWFLQNQSPYRQAWNNQQQFSADDDRILPLLAAFAAREQPAQPADVPQYVTRANRLSSMLFDADPQSDLAFIPSQSNFIAIQRARLDRLCLSGERPGILAKVAGRFSGAVYTRTFATPDGRPYVFLGRHRVAVRTGSKLEARIIDLAKQGRSVRIADIIVRLQSDAMGFPSEELAGLLDE